MTIIHLGSVVRCITFIYIHHVDVLQQQPLGVIYKGEKYQFRRKNSNLERGV